MKLILIGPPLVGKTSLLKEINSLGIKTFEADEFIKEIYKKPNEGFNIIKQEFGEEYVKNDQIDRKKLAKLVTNNQIKLNRLNELVHQIIIDEFQFNDYAVGEIPFVTLDNNNLKINKKVLLLPATKDIIKERIKSTSRKINPEFIEFILSKWNDIDINNYDYVIKVDDLTNYKEEAKNIVKIFFDK